MQTFTAELEVVKIDTVKRAKDWSEYPIVLTKLKINKQWGDQVNFTHIWMDNSPGLDCQQGLFPDSIGQRYIITGVIYEDKRYQQYLTKNEPNNFLYTTTCGKPVIFIQNNIAIGFIDSNRDNILSQTYHDLKINNPAEAQKFYTEVYETKFHHFRFQHMKVDDVYDLIEEAIANP